MDLYAYTRIEDLKELLPSEPPRLGGIRLMSTEEPVEYPESLRAKTFNKYVGKDVIYIHTRCGARFGDDNSDSNYVTCGLKDWEEENKDLVLDSINDDVDCTYRDTYIMVSEDKRELYEKLLAMETKRRLSR